MRETKRFSKNRTVTLAAWWKRCSSSHAMWVRRHTTTDGKESKSSIASADDIPAFAFLTLSLAWSQVESKTGIVRVLRSWGNRKCFFSPITKAELTALPISSTDLDGPILLVALSEVGNDAVSTSFQSLWHFPYERHTAPEKETKMGEGGGQIKMPS